MARRAGAILTLTVNPAVDVAFAVDRLEASQKLRCHDVRHDPGGGGVNVARAIRRLGGQARAIVLAGGVTGERLTAMLAASRLPHLVVPTAGETREDVTARDLSTGAQYRFVMPGPRVRRADCEKALEEVRRLASSGDVVVASGSLPPGARVGFYRELALLARQCGARLALDASGPPLRRALDAGVWLIKPSLLELEELVGRRLPDIAARVAACRSLVATGGAELVAASLGAEGAVLVSRDAAWRAEAPAIAPISTVGAGDSFMGALVLSLAANGNLSRALARAVAAGSAALMAPGTQLCRSSDVQALLKSVEATPVTTLSATPRRPEAA